MTKYFILQIKRLMHLLPFILLTMVALFLCLYAAFSTVLSSSENDGNSRFKLAFVCSDDDPYFKAGLEIVQSYDSSRFAIEASHMDENEAIQKLENGSLDAYVVIPSGYISDAMDGRLGSLKYVSTVGAADLSMLFKEEITAVVSDIIIACEKGMHGIAQISEDYELQEVANVLSAKISMRYVDYVIDRANMYYVEELGIQDSLGFDGYLFSGFMVLIFVVMLTPAGVYFINRDTSVEAMLKSKRIGPLKQITAEYFALLIVCIVPVILLSTVTSVFSSSITQNVYRLFQAVSLGNLMQIIAVVCVVVAVGYFIFQLTSELVSGMLLYFFLSIGLSFVSGCFYPTYFFPDSVKHISSYIPHGVCRLLLSDCISGTFNVENILILAVYCFVLLFAAYFVRCARLRLPKR